MARLILIRVDTNHSPMVKRVKNGSKVSKMGKTHTILMVRLGGHRVTHGDQGLTGRVFQLRVGSGSGIGKNYRVGSGLGLGSGIGIIY